MSEVCYYCGDELEGGLRGAICRLNVKDKELVFCCSDCCQNYQDEVGR